jgi:hypothetical protein
MLDRISIIATLLLSPSIPSRKRLLALARLLEMVASKGDAEDLDLIFLCSEEGWNSFSSFLRTLFTFTGVQG